MPMDTRPHANRLERMATNLGEQGLGSERKSLEAQIGIEDLHVATIMRFDAFESEPDPIMGRYRGEPIGRVHLEERRDVQRFRELRPDSAAFVSLRDRNTVVTVRASARTRIDHVPMTFLPRRVRDFEDHDVDPFGSVVLRLRREAVVNGDRVEHIPVRPQLGEREDTTLRRVTGPNLDEVADRISERQRTIAIEIVRSFEPDRRPDRPTDGTNRFGRRPVRSRTVVLEEEQEEWESKLVSHRGKAPMSSHALVQRARAHSPTPK